VIAIENARLFEEVQAKTRDLEESLQQQTATAEVLQVIGGSMADTRPVFERIVESMMQLFDCTVSALMLAPGDGLIHLGARRGPGSEAIDRAYPQPVGETMAAIVLEKRRQTYIADVMNDPHASRGLRKIAEVYGNYSVVMTPMIWEDQGIGLISVAREPNAAFNAKELSLLRTFADQAVIAIQNARLFNETKEALERQTATADILNVIASSPSDVQPVFEAIAERSNRLIGGLSTAVYSVTDGVMHLMAFTRTSPEADEALQASFPRPLADAIWGDQLLKGEIVEIPDAEAEFAEQPVLRKMMQLRG
jgi:GAF domain-containing protein